MNLKPCPFCGGEAKYDCLGDFSVAIGCPSCGISFGYCGDLEEAKKRTISAWNNRHYSPEVMQAVKRMKTIPKLKPVKNDSWTGFICPKCLADLDEIDKRNGGCDNWNL